MYTCYPGASDNEAKDGIESPLSELLSLLKNRRFRHWHYMDNIRFIFIQDATINKIKIKRSQILFMGQIWPIFFMNQYQLSNLDQNIILSWLYFIHPSLLLSFVPHMKHVRLLGALLSDSVFQLSLEKGSVQTFR